MTKDAMTQQPAVEPAPEAVSSEGEWDDLERLAKAATPGEWQAHDLHPQTYGIAWVSSPDVHKLATCDGVRRSDTHGFCLRMEDDENEHNAAFIAAANPATVLKLIAAVRALKQPDSRSGAGEDGTAGLTRPIVGIENRTAQEAFDIMCDRITPALCRGEIAPARPQQPDTLAERDREIEGLRARNAEVSMLAHRWMVAHDRLKSGEPYDLPSPADLPAAEADAAKLREALVEISEGYARGGIEDLGDAQRVAAQALQAQERT